MPQLLCTAASDLETLFAAYAKTPYSKLSCWELAHRLYKEGLGLDVPLVQQYAVRDFQEVWWHDDPNGDRTPPQKWDLLLFVLPGRAGDGGHHVGIALPDGRFLHTTAKQGPHIATLGRYAPYLRQIARPKSLMVHAVPLPPLPAVRRHDPAHVSIRLVESPIMGQYGHRRETWRTAPPGQTIAAYLANIQGDMAVWHNGMLREPDTWGVHDVSAGDELIVSPRWGSGAAFGFFVLTVAISILSQAIGVALQRAPKSKREEEEERTQTYAGIQSRNTPGGVVPLYWGRHRVGMTRLFAQVRYDKTRIDSTEFAPQADAGLPIIGSRYGNTGSDETGSTSDGNIEILVAATNLHWRVGDVLHFFGSDAFTTQPIPPLVIANIIARRNETWWVELANTAQRFKNRFVAAGQMASLSPRPQPVEPSGEHATVDWLGAIGEGPVENIYRTSVEINGQPIGNFPEADVFIRKGHTPQSRVPGFPDARRTFSVGSEILRTPALTYTTTVPVEGFALNIDFNNGLLTVDKRGDHRPNKVTIEYRYQRGSDPFKAWFAHDLVGASLAPVRISIERHDLFLSVYTIEVRLVSVFDNDPLTSRFEPTLTSITERTPSNRSYDGTALVGIRNIRADRLAAAGLENVTVVIDGLNVRQGTFANRRTRSFNRAWITMDVLGRLGVPDSAIDLTAFQTWATYCDEPVASVDTFEQYPWVDPGGTVFTLPGQSPFTEGSDRRGKKRRSEAAVLIENSQREQTVLHELTAANRVELVDTGGKWSPRILRDETPVMMFSSANALNLHVTSTLDQDEITVIQVSFNDHHNNWERTTLSWPPVNQWPANVNILEVDLPTVTDAEEAQRWAQLELNLRQLPTDGISFETTEALPLQRYDLFWFSHEQQGWGDAGRVAIDPANSTTNMVLDHAVEYVKANETYFVYVRHADGSIDTRRNVDIQPGDTTLSELPFTGDPLSQTPVGDVTLWAYGYFDQVDRAVLIFRCMENSYDASTGRFTVKAVEHIPAAYTDPAPVPPRTITTLPRMDDPPPAIGAVVGETVRISDSLLAVLLSWTLLSDAIAVSPRLAPYAGALIQRRVSISGGGSGVARMGVGQMSVAISASEAESADDFETIGEVRNGATNYRDTLVTAGTTYTYRIIPRSDRGVHGQAGVLIHTVDGSFGANDARIPETPQNLRLQGQAVGSNAFDGPDVVFEWDPPSNSTQFIASDIIRDWLIEIWGTDSQSNLAYRLHPKPGSTAPVCVIEPRFHFTHALNTETALAAGQVVAQRKITIRVRARTHAGVKSLVPAQKTVENAAPSMAAISPTLLSLVEGFYIQWPTFAAPRDIASYRVLVDTQNPPRLTGSLIDDTIAAPQQTYTAQNLTAQVRHFLQVIPNDTFGAGIGSPILSAVAQLSPQQWAFFVREFSSPDIVFTGGGGTVFWTAGTLNYTDELGAGQSQAISAGFGVHAAGSSVFVYYVMGTSQFLPTIDSTEAFRGDRVVIAVYNGGSTVTEVYGAKMSGTDIIAQTIGAAQLVVGQAVITESAQIELAIVNTAQLTDAAITRAKIDVLAVEEANIADLQVTTLKIGDNAVSKLVTDRDEIGATFGTTEIVIASFAMGVFNGLGILSIDGRVEYAPTSTEQGIFRLREDSATGTQIDGTRIGTSANIGLGLSLFEMHATLFSTFIPDATETKTIVLTAEAVAGTQIYDGAYLRGIYHLK